GRALPDIRFADGKRVKGKVLGNFRTVDAGMAQITDKGEYPHVDVAPAGSVKPGHWVLAMGYPVSFAKGQRPPIRIGRVLRTTATTTVTDCPLMGGDSGGPLFDLEGRVIGLNSRVSGGGTGNGHLPLPIYHTNLKRMLAGEDWGEQRCGRRRNPQPTPPDKAKEKPKDKAQEKPKDPPKDKPRDKAQEKPAAVAETALQAQRQPGGRGGPVPGTSANERNHESVRAAFK